MKIAYLLNQIEYQKFIGDDSTEIINAKIFEENNAEADVLMWVNSKNLSKISNLKYGTVICESIENIEPHNTCNYLVSHNPRLLFNTIIKILFPKNVTKGIEKSADVDPTCILGENIYIGKNVVVEKNCVIGSNSIIGHNTVIKSETIIGLNVTIGSNNVIGGIGFGYEKDLDGAYTQIHHIGNVLIEDFVEIGNNTCIDRAVMGSTILKKNSKIDNLVHIAHGAIIGENSLIIANAMIAGSSIIGNNVWVAPSANVLNKISISDNSTIGMGAVVLKSVIEPGDILVGNPAKSIKK
jgi:UDP-3-O-[3-hydroxymyristoyl] glucosamine N-acyltransferase